MFEYYLFVFLIAHMGICFSALVLFSAFLASRFSASHSFLLRIPFCFLVSCTV